MPWIGKVLLTALSYLVLGRIARLLNVPPDYVTPLFPPAGLAVGVLVAWGLRICPGVFLGAVLLNSTLPWEQGFSFAAADLARGIIIAVGVVLQACAGIWMVKRWVGLPNPLAHERSIVLFLLLTGPVACVINASIGTAALALTGTLPAGAALRTWTLWWIGDSFGVLIVAPLLLAFFGEPWQAWRPRRFAVGSPLAFTFLAVVVMYHLSTEWEQQRTHSELRQRMDVAVDRIRKHLNDALRLLNSVQHFYAATGSMERRSFHAFISDSLPEQLAIEGLMWLRPIPAQQQRQFERELETASDQPASIWEIDAQGRRQPALTIRDRIVVEFAEPSEAMRQLVGLDVSSLPEEYAALNNTIRWKHVASVGPIQLPAKSIWPVGLEFYIAAGPRSGADSPAGFLGTIVNLEKVMNDAVSDALAANLDIELTLETAQPVVLWQQQAILSKRGQFPVERYRIAIPVGFDHCAFQLSATPTAAYLARVYGWQNWSILLGGMMLTAVVGTLLLVITGRTIRVETLVAERTAALRHSESRLRAVLDNAGDGIVTLDEFGRIESANPAAQTLLGYDATELFGQKLADLMGEHCRGRLIQSLEASSGTVRARLTDVEARTKSGDVVPLELSISEVHLNTQRFFTIVLHDLTEQRRIDRLKNAFISTVSHELRTPLTSIRGSLGLLTGGATGQLSQDAARMIEIAARNTERLSRLVDDILDVQKIESDQLPLKLQPTNIARLLEQAVATNQGYAGGFQVSLRTHVDLHPETLCTLDADRFVQVLTNLISNAVKFSPAGGVVDIDLRRVEQTVYIAVQDYGPGIPADFQPRVFQKFAQADVTDSRHAHGTGLGLSISKALVELMGGSIRYVTAPNQGTTFTMEFPVTARAAPAL